MINAFMKGKSWCVYRNHRQIFEFAPGWGWSAWIEFPSEWHENGYGMIHFNLIWGRFYIMFPWHKRYEDHGQCEGPRYGFNLFEDLFWIYHGNSTGRPNDKSCTTIYMPWHWKHCQHDVLNDQGKWEPYVGSWERERNKDGSWGEKKKPDGRVLERYRYTYTLNSGEVQERKATIFVERRIWRRKFWWPRSMERQSIHVDFDGEVGEETGTWKGGCTGCGYDMLPGEHALDTLRRMERERKF